ncbi:transglutaminase [Clostridia bacterium]|nr:transglutaminase [Clostridia bacterium]
MYTDLSFLAYPLPEDIRRLKDFGDFTRAKSVINLRLVDSKVPEALKRRLRYELSIIDATPGGFPLSESEAFEKIAALVDGFTMDELNALRDDQTLDWIYIGGKVYYKDDCAASMIKVRKDLHPRLRDKAVLNDRAEMFKTLNAAVDDMKKNGHAAYRYNIKTVMSVDEAARQPGKIVRCYLTLPIRDAQCKPIGAIITAPEAKHIAPEDHPQRTAFFEEIYRDGLTFTADYSYEIDAPYVNPDFGISKAGSLRWQFPRDTAELPPQIMFTPFIRALADELAGGEPNPLKAARHFYDYVTTNTVYRYTRAYFTYPNIPEHFGAGQRGDCGMHALLFIALCRCHGIPARWQAGLYVNPHTGDVGNHDWARFYVEPYGWLFADGSFGGAAYREGDIDRWNFYFSNLDPFRMVANSDLQVEFDPPMKHGRWDPYDNQSGEIEYDDRALTHGEITSRRTLADWERLA